MEDQGRTHHPAKKRDSQETIIKRRNDRLVALFEHLNYPVKIMGNSNNPAIVLDNKYILSAHVKNFDLYFTDKPFDGKPILTVKLTKEIEVTRQEVTEAILEADHRKAYRVAHNDADLLLVGFNRLDRSDKSTMFPVFAKDDCKIYFTPEGAQDIIDLPCMRGYNCGVISPQESIIEIISKNHETRNRAINQINYNS